jgi:uncharacterized membrane protein
VSSAAALAPAAARAAAVAAPAERLSSIDVVRGLVMAVMALDHVREFFQVGRMGDPMNLAVVTPGSFFARWITHVCAPAFVLLSGTGAFLYGRRLGTRGELASFLLARGVFLILLELTLLAWTWSFSLIYPVKFLSVLWAIGVSMICLAGLVFLPLRAIFAFGAAIVCGHDLLNGIRVAAGSPWHIPWVLLHQRDSFAWGPYQVRVSYPVLPWIGLIALGYCLGRVYLADFPAARRRRLLYTLAGASVAAFVLLRATNQYGDPFPFRVHAEGLYTLMSFVNTSKYGPSLLFLLMTGGPILWLLARAEEPGLPLQGPLRTLGREPLFYYVAHWLWIHLLAVAAALALGQSWSAFDFDNRFAGLPQPLHFPLWANYAITAFVVVSLYPLCRAYGALKRRLVWRSLLVL